MEVSNLRVPQEIERPDDLLNEPSGKGVQVSQGPIKSALSAVESAQAAVIFKTPSRVEISAFIGSSTLFAYVGGKGGAIDRIDSVAVKGGTGGKLRELVRLFNEGPMSVKHPLFRDSDFADLIVLAHISGGISEMQLGTAFYWKSALEHYGYDSVQEMPFFDADGKVVANVQSIMKETVKLSGNLRIASDDQLAIWFEEMKARPASEKMFIHFPYLFCGQDALLHLKCRVDILEMVKGLVSFFERRYLLNSPTILDAIYVTGGGNLFNRIEFEGDSHRMCISMGAACTLFAIVGGKARGVVRFGISESLRENGLTTTRDISVRSPYADLPDEADDYWAPFDEFTAHDLLYHLPIVAFMPREHQRLFIDLSDILRAKGERDLADRCEDMECLTYRKETGVGPFLQSLEFHAIAACDRKTLRDLRETYGTLKGSKMEKKEQFIRIFAQVVEKDNEEEIYQNGEKLFAALRELLDKRPHKTAFESELATRLAEMKV